MAPDPRITLIVPVYNGLPHLPATLDSIRAQTVEEIEIICADDGSTDGSAEYIASVNDPRLRLLRLPHRGLAATLNDAFAQARADIVARCDQDDLCDPQRLEKQYAAFTERWDAVFCQIYKFGQARRWNNADRQRADSGKVLPVHAARDGCQVHSTLMMRRELFLRSGGYREACYPCDDWDLQLRLEEMGRVGILAEALVGYRMHPDGGTHGRFFIMQRKRRWVEACAKARAEGKPEPDFAGYEAGQRRFPLRRLNRYRKDWHHYWMRQGGEDYLNGHALLAAFRLGLAIILAPGRSLKRLLFFIRSCGGRLCRR